MGRRQAGFYFYNSHQAKESWFFQNHLKHLHHHVNYKRFKMKYINGIFQTIKTGV